MTRRGGEPGPPGCCDDLVASRTLLSPAEWPAGLAPAAVLVSLVAPNEHGGLDLNFLGRYYAKGATFFDHAGQERDWKAVPAAIPCGGEDHDTPYSYLIPKGRPAPGPLCVPATPPTAVALALAGLLARGVKPGISILGGHGANLPPLPSRSQLRRLVQLPEPRFGAFVLQVRAAATVLHQWGFRVFDVDFEGGLEAALNVTRLGRLVEALRVEGAEVTLTLEAPSMPGLRALLGSPGPARPDLVQLMLENYYEDLPDGIEDAKDAAAASGYPLEQMTLGVKPQCGVASGTLKRVKTHLPAVAEAGLGVMLWNLGRDYPCEGTCGGTCTKTPGQAVFSEAAPFGFAQAIAAAYGRRVLV